MSLTGSAVQQGNSPFFGVAQAIGSIPRSFVSFNGEPYVITRSELIHITDIENGSGVVIQNNPNFNLSGVTGDATCGFAFGSAMYFMQRSEGWLCRFDDPLTGDASVVGGFSGITSPAAAATDGTTIWIYDSTDDTLHTIDILAAVNEIGAVAFDIPTPSKNVNGAFYYDGQLYLVDNGTDRLYVVNDLGATNLTASAVDSAVVQFGVSQVGPNGAGDHNGEIYMAGGNPDALYRFHNVRWDETIAAVEVDEGSNGSLDLSTVSKDAASFEFAPSNTSRSWLTLSGMDLVVTNAPAVSSDTDFEAQVRAVRGSKHEDKTLTVRVTAGAAPPPIFLSNAPTSLSLTATHNSISATWGAPTNNGGESPTHYEIRTAGGEWIDAGLDLTHVFQNLSPETQYLIQVAAVNSAGRGATASAIITTDAAPSVITVPGVPRSLSLTETHNSIVATWSAAADNGGESPSRYDIRINNGNWIDTGLDLSHTFSRISPETQYTD